MATKVLTAMVMGAVSVAIVFAVGGFSGAVQMPGWAWVVSALVAWIGAIVFAAFGLFIGYLVPSENVMQLLGPALALLALMGGIFVPLDVLSDTLQTLAKFTPAYGVGARQTGGANTELLVVSLSISAEPSSSFHDLPKSGETQTPFRYSACGAPVRGSFASSPVVPPFHLTASWMIA